MDSPPDGPHPFISLFSALAAQIQTWVDNGLDPEWIRLLTASHLTWLVPAWGNVSLLNSLNLSPDPLTAPSLPQEELWLLHTSFDLAFASLAGQVKELTAKVNGSEPPPKVATAKKPSAQPTPKPHAQPPIAPAPTPASRPAPPSFASVVKAPVQPSLVMALCPSTPGADVPLAIH